MTTVYCGGHGQRERTAHIIEGNFTRINLVSATEVNREDTMTSLLVSQPII